ncbi:MAG: hypothetical protein H6832_03180 [Planctomycetes bacterium]|nr:hypothetical protein [Planctomycetota bacterium]
MTFTTSRILATAIGVWLVGCNALAQERPPARVGDVSKAESRTTQDDSKEASEKTRAKVPARIGDAYPFATCPVSGKKLGSMGEPVVELYDGREVRFCCNGCPKNFEKDLAKSLATLDEKIIDDQRALYPLETSLVSGAKLSGAKLSGAKLSGIKLEGKKTDDTKLEKEPVDFVYGNRLVRVGSDEERATFVAHAAKYMEALDKAVVAAQKDDYPLDSCPISGEKLGSMGNPIDRVVAGRLVRLCCKSCVKKLDQRAPMIVKLVDAQRARAARSAKERAENDTEKKGAPPEDREKPARK